MYAPQGPNGDWEIGSWDPESVMNYCSPRWNNGGQLSTGDIAGIQQAYPTRKIPEGIFQDGPAVLYSNGQGHHCLFADMPQYKCLMNDPTARYIRNSARYAASDFPHDTYDGICGSPNCTSIPSGVIRDAADGVFYSNGQGHFCRYPTTKFYACSTGDKSGKLIAGAERYHFAAWTGMTYDGNCWSARCPY
jgi:hypothetical protein